MQIRKLAVDIFRSNAQMAFQSGSRLRDRVYTETGVQAETVHFPVFGTGDARTRASQADIVPANLANKRPSVKLEPFEWFDLLDRQDTALTNVDAARNYGIVAGRALGRQFDQHIISGALQPGAGNVNVSNAYSRSGMAAGGLAFTTAASGKIGMADLGKAAAMIMDEIDGDSMDLTLVAPARQFEQWADDDKFLRMEYLQQGRGQSNVMVTGNFGGMMFGFTVILIGQQARRTGHGKLPDKKCWVFDRNCVGLAVGTTENVGIMEWIPYKRSMMIGAEANAGACRINNSGIIEITIKT